MLQTPSVRHSHLRRLFVNLAAMAVPVPLALAACGGATVDPDDEETGGGGSAGSGGVQLGSGGILLGTGATTGGVPVYTGSVGGYPTYPGLGGWVSTGGFPMYPGMGGAPGSGAVPIYTGMGGASGSGAVPIYTGMGGAGGDDDPDEPEDGGVGDSGPPAPCGPGVAGCGRRPPGLELATYSGRDVRGYFEAMARLEAASVPAFRLLGRELAAHGAPRSLLRAARRSAREEVQHARIAKRLAERYGGAYLPPRITRKAPRDLEAIALDNAAEGCVRETFGAMIVTWQARAASDSVVRRALRSVALDETRHAALAIRVAHWCDRRLSDAAVRRVKELRRSTAEEVRRELALSSPSAELVSIAGLPSRAESLRLVGAMTKALWS